MAAECGNGKQCGNGKKEEMLSFAQSEAHSCPVEKAGIRCVPDSRLERCYYSQLFFILNPEYPGTVRGKNMPKVVSRSRIPLSKGRT